MDDKDAQKILSNIVVRDGCWLWTRGCGRGGYGQVSISGRTRRAHRVSYELVYGMVLTPDQLLHHTCRNTSCINPNHLEITSQTTHIDSGVYGNKEKTHCPHGHEYTPENTWWNRQGRSRECYECKKRRIRRRYYRKRQEVAERLKTIALKYDLL